MRAALPNHFIDEDILRGQFKERSERGQARSEEREGGDLDCEPAEAEAAEDSTKRPSSHRRDLKYDLTLGLLMRISTGMYRVVKRSVCSNPPLNDYTKRFENLFYYFCNEDSVDLMVNESGWRMDTLVDACKVLSKKSSNLSIDLLHVFDIHPLLPPSAEGKIQYNKSFLIDVAEYHRSLSRPDDVFAHKAQSESELELLSHLASLEREVCHICLGKKQVYCGSCGGIRLASASSILPHRIGLPFDILLLVHWQESLHKCTGVHAAVLCNEGTVQITSWPRDRDEPEFIQFIKSLNPLHDVVLFPSETAQSADDFDWRIVDNAAGEVGKKWRLVVLEASWTSGKKMANHLVSLRASLGCSPLRWVTLEDVVGRYWRFHSEGLAAVSTIEAIAHTATAAGLATQPCEDLLVLFNLQRYRVLSNVEDGGKVPRAMLVSGAGEGGWEHETSGI
jgi:DTW domain-containing protein YfiP